MFATIGSLALKFMAKYWKYILVATMVVGAFLAGRFLVPQKVVTQTVTVKAESQTNKTVDQDTKIEYRYVDRPVDHIITKIVIKRPDGTVIDKTTDDVHQGNTEVTGGKQESKDTQVQVKTVIEYKDKIVEKVVDKTTNERFEIGLMAGYGLYGDKTNVISKLYDKMPEGMVLGAQVNYKLLQIKSLNVKGGVWGSSRGDVGVGLTASF